MIQIYSKDNCVQCMQAENLLKAKKIPYQTQKLDKDYTREQLEQKCLPFVSRSFPVLFHSDGTFMGGLNEMKTLVIQGKL